MFIASDYLCFLKRNLAHWEYIHVVNSLCLISYMTTLVYHVLLLLYLRSSYCKPTPHKMGCCINHPPQMYWFIVQCCSYICARHIVSQSLQMMHRVIDVSMHHPNSWLTSYIETQHCLFSTYAESSRQFVANFSRLPINDNFTYAFYGGFFFWVPWDPSTYIDKPNQSLYSLSGKTSYRKTLWSLEATRVGVIMIVSLWNLAGISVVLLPRSLSNFRTIGKV